MAADSDGSGEPQLESMSPDSVTTIVTCEGDYYDPKFHDKFKIIIGKLENMLCEQPRKQCLVKNSPCRTDSVQKDTKCECKSANVQKSNGLLKVSKLEPWNSVRVTLSIPREAAARLRQMANEGSAQLRQLGILSVQVEGDQVISLRIASRFGNENETQEIVLNTSASSSASTSSAVVAAIDQSLSASNSSVTRFLQTSTTNPVQQSVTTTSVPVTNSLPNGTTNEPSTPAATRVNSEFRSPNVVCPSDTQVPLKVATSSNLAQVGAQRPHEALNRPFPFASMQQAAIAIQNRTQQDFHNFAAGSRTIPTPSSATPSQSVISGNTTVPYTQPPPPYPSTINKIVTSTNANNTPATPAPLSGQNIAISSPLLVNLLQNEGTQNQKLDSKTSKPKVPVVSTIKNAISSNNVAVVNNNSNSTGTFVNISSTNAKLTNDTSRVPPLPQQTNNLLVGTFDSPAQPNVVQNVQTSVVTTSSTVPSPHLSKSNILVNQNKLQPPPRPPTAPIGTVPNPRLQQTQQLRNLQQQLIQQQQQSRLLQPQKILVSPPTSNVASLRTIQNYRNPPSAPASGPLFNSTSVSQLNTTQPQPQPQPQPPPYPGSSRTTIIPPQNVNRTNTVIGNVASNNVNYPQDFQQKIQSPSQNPPNRTFNSQFPSSSVPETILPFGPSVVNNNVQTVATQPVSQISSYNQLNLDTSLSNITPSLTDLSKTDLDSLLPSLTDLDGTDLNDLAKDIVDNLVPDDVVESVPSSEPTPIQIPDELTSKGKKRVFLINPANGMLEPMPSESSSSESESEDGEIKKNKKDGIMDVFSELNEHSNSIYSDDDTSSTANSTKKGFDGTTDQSDSENKLSDSSSKLHRPKSYPKIRRESPNLLNKVAQKIASKEKMPTEKIKLRLKLEKSEPINSAYKVDVSFVNRQEPKRATNTPASISPTTKNSPSVPTTFTNNTNTVASTVATTTLPANNSTEEPRVPPLHISLRGRNSVVISNKSSKKHSAKGGVDPPLESYDDKTSKKSKIRSKDKDLKIKSRLYHKDLSTNSLGKSNLHDFVENDLKNDLKLKSKTEITDEISTTLSSTYRREPGEIVLPNLKSFDSTKSSSKSSKKLSLLSSTKMADNERTLQTLNSEIITNFATNADFIKNHKKSKPEFLNKLAFKSKFDKTKSKVEHVNEIKKVDDNKSTLKRHHSSSPTSIGAANVGTEVGTLVNGLLNSPDNKKRKLSDSILDSPIVSSVAPVVCLNSIGSTNTGTIHTSTNIQSNTNLSSSVNTTDSLSSNKMHTKSLSPMKSRKDKDRPNLDTLTKTKDVNESVGKGTNSSYRPGTSSKSKDLNRDKTYSKIVAEKRLNQQESSKSKLLTDLKFKSNKTEIPKSMPTKLSALTLPTGEIDMEAKFKQRLLEDTKPRTFESDKMKLKSLSNERLDHKKLTNKNTKVILNRVDETILHNRLLINASEKVENKLDDTRQGDKKSVNVHEDKLEDNLRQLLEHNDEPDIDNDRLETEILGDINLAQILTESDLDTKQLNKEEHDESTKSSIQVVQTQAQPNRSPPLSNSTGQGEDSGIESMDALSEKSPNNQSSQSPHCHTEIISNLVDTLTGKDSPATKDFVTDTPENHPEIDRLLKKPGTDLTELGDIEAELAKMEGYGANGECTDILLTQINHSLCPEGSSDSNIVEQLKSELESSYNIKESDNPKKIPSEEEILAHIKSFSDKNSLNLTDYLTKQKNCFEPMTRNDEKTDLSENQSHHKDLNENKSDIDTKHRLADNCCTEIRRVDNSDKIDPLASDLKVEAEVKTEKADTKKSVKVDENIYDFTTDSLEQETEKLLLVKKEDKCDKDGGSQVDHLDNDLLNHRDSPIDNDFDPLPIRRTPPLYTYSNPDKQRNDTDSPIVGLSDLDDGSECHSDLNSEDFNDILDMDVKTNDDSTNSTNSKMLMLRRRKQSSKVRESGLSDGICTEKQKSLLEQLLIEIPNNEYLDKSSFSSMSHSPAISEKSLTSTKTSVRTRSSSKLNSPDIILDVKHNLRTPKHSPSVTLKVSENNSRANSPAILHRASPKMNQTALKGIKRKRRESESSTQSTQSTEDASVAPTTRNTKKLRKCSENPENSVTKTTVPGSNTLKQKTISASTTTTTRQTKTPLLNPNRKLNTNEESSDSDEPLIEIAGKVRNLNVCNVAKSTVATRNKVPTTTAASKILTTNTTSVATIKLTTTDDQKASQSVVGTRRSVRHNTTVTCATSSTAGTPTVTTSNNLKTRSTKLGTVTTNAVTTTNTLIATNSPVLSSPIDAVTNTDASNTSSMASRRKTRSAGNNNLKETSQKSEYLPKKTPVIMIKQADKKWVL